MKVIQKRRLFGGISFAAALFIFQACYGMPQDMLDDVYIEGIIVSRTTSQPLRGIKVEDTVAENYAISDDQGRFAFYTPRIDSVKLSIEDTDPNSDGSYVSKDSVLINPEKEIFLNIVLEEN